MSARMTASSPARRKRRTLGAVPADPAVLGRRIASYREQRGISIATAARRAAISSSRWHAIEQATPSGSTGKPSIPIVPVLRGIADAIGAPRSELLELAGYLEDAAVDRSNEAPTDGTSVAVRLGRLREELDALTQAVASMEERLSEHPPPARPARHQPRRAKGAP